MSRQHVQVWPSRISPHPVSRPTRTSWSRIARLLPRFSSASAAGQRGHRRPRCRPLRGPHARHEAGHLRPELEAGLLRIVLGGEVGAALQEQARKGARIGPGGMQRGQGTEALPHQDGPTLHRHGVADGWHHTAREHARVRRVGGVPLVARTRCDQGDAHPREATLGDQRADVRRQLTVGVHLGTVVADQEWQSLPRPCVRRRPELEVDPADGGARQSQRGPLGRDRKEVQPSRSPVARQRDPRVVAERPRYDLRIARVGLEVAVDVEQVLQPVDRQPPEPHLPATRDSRHRGVAEPEVGPDADALGVVVRVGVADDDVVALHGGHQPGHPPDSRGARTSPIRSRAVLSTAEARLVGRMDRAHRVRPRRPRRGCERLALVSRRLPRPREPGSVLADEWL